ncbi:hypothetical protein EC968_002388 [Mortierella alpina]|nr:hypothetical protein EC968_002388 [Mortierella alpina]
MSDQEQSHSSVNAWEDDGGDIWDDDDSISYDRAIAEKEWSRLHETFGNTGYREGIEEGKEGTLQQGFNQGWSEGVNYGHELGRLRGLISPLLEYVRSSTKTETTPPSTSNHPLSKLSLQEKGAWIERASELIKELTEIDIAKVFDKAYFDDGRGPSDKAKAKAKAAAADGSSKSECCGGASSSSSSNGDTCCKKGDSIATTTTTTTTTTDGEASACQSAQAQPSQSCSSSKGKGACASKQSGIDETKDGSRGEKDEEWSSRPEQVINDYRNKVRELLKEAGLESLIDTV